MNSNLQKIAESLQMTKTHEIKSQFFEIKGNLVKCDRQIIQMSNITMITITDFAKVQFQYWTILVGLLGLYILKENFLENLLFGIMLLAVPVVAFIIWKKQTDQWEKRKKLNFVLNSGNTYTMVFSDLEFLDRVVAVFTNILASTNHNQNIYFDMQNSDMRVIQGNMTQNNIHDNQFANQSSAVRNNF